MSASAEDIQRFGCKEERIGRWPCQELKSDYRVECEWQQRIYQIINNVRTLFRISNQSARCLGYTITGWFRSGGRFIRRYFETSNDDRFNVSAFHYIAHQNDAAFYRAWDYEYIINVVCWTYARRTRRRRRTMRSTYVVILTNALLTEETETHAQVHAVSP